jgi:hypothetical protein
MAAKVTVTRAIWWAALVILGCAFVLSTAHTIKWHYTQLEQLLQFQDDIFDSPREKWEDVRIQGQYPAHFAKNLESGHRLFALFSGMSICSAAAIAVFLCISYFLERRRAGNVRINTDGHEEVHYGTR